ncbi:MAG: cadherin-like beta sandwich domain-containing protein, partial [Clostridium sp.]|nr:cadherin-like beta sandwich domain-containing protein [Clostridium sp.]
IRTSYVKISDDAEFLAELAEFPSSYHSAIKELHKEYPNWHFVAVNTGLDWQTVIENESKLGRNTIMSNQPNGGSAGTYSAPFSFLSTEAGAYDWAKDKYTLCDGTNWFTANSAVISHYMDPRNSLTPNLIWQFESLAFDKRQKESVVESILSNTFMNGSYSVKDKLTGKIVSGKYSDAFMDAGKINNASPYFLSIRSKQELGLKGSGSSSGTYPGYEGYYNYYNIGAYDSATNQAIANGLKYASQGSTYNRPWTNPYKAIVGGAQYIASAYIAKGQNTTYFQKFNVVSAPFYSHQYMTNVQAPNSESKNTFTSYSQMGIAKDDFVFYIPVYKNMPSKPCELPPREGNPNSYLKNITVKNGSTSHPLTPTFNYQTKSYTMVVDHNVSSVVVNASTISSRATVSGTGTYSLTSGATKTISLVGTAENGTRTTYKLKIFRKAS